MKLLLSERDLNDAVETYVKTLGMDLSDKTISVDFTAGRGANGNTATVEFFLASGSEPTCPEKVEQTAEHTEAVEEEADIAETEVADSDNMFD